MQSAPMYTTGRRKTPKEILRTIMPSAGQAMGKLLRQLPMAGAFFLMSIASCFHIPSPYAVCGLIAMLTAGMPAAGAMLGVALGIGFRLLWGIDPDPAQLLVCCLCRGILPYLHPQKWGVRIFALAMLILRALPGILESAEAQGALLAGAGILLGMVSLPALCRAATLLKSGRTGWSEDDVLCMAFPALLVLSGAARLTIFSINIGNLLAAVAVLAIGWMLGSAMGVCAGLSCGLALMMGGQGALPVVTLTVGALAAGLLQGKNRLGAGVLFALFHGAALYLTTFALDTGMAAAAGLGALAFALIPTKMLKKITAFARRLRWNKPRENAYTRLRMQQWVQAIDQMADALPKPRMEPITADEESETITDRLCQDCDRLPICWRDQFDKTREAMQALSLRPDDEEETYRIINKHFDFCPRISRIPGILNQLDTARQQRCSRALCADYERTMLQTHLTALSQAAQCISLEGMARTYDEQEWLERAEEALQGLRFPGRALYVKKVDGRLTACLEYEPTALRLPDFELVAQHMGLCLGAKMQVTAQKAGKLFLEAEPVLTLLTGMATSCAVTPERKIKVGKKLDNGDAVLVRQLTGGRAMVALSDGMGHGAEAGEESRKTLEMLSLCMEAGYSRGQAMTAVNGSMLSATGGEQFATVDLCLIDLWTGSATLNKLGACASVLVQGQKARIIEGEALPLGIIEHVAPMEHTFQMGENDLLLLMSDGVTDAFANEEQILAIIRRGYQDTPQHLADTLLQEALIQQNGLPADDMTVLCVRVKQRYPERKWRTEFAANNN